MENDLLRYIISDPYRSLGAGIFILFVFAGLRLLLAGFKAKKILMAVMK